MARPKAVSAAATVKIKSTKIWPKKSSKKTAKTIKFILIDNNNNSKQINIKSICLRERNIPNRPKIKIILENSIINDIAITKNKFLISYLKIYLKLKLSNHQ